MLVDLRRVLQCTTLSLLTLPLAVACDEAGPIANLRPMVALDSCTGGEVIVNDMSVGGVSECDVDFGASSFGIPSRVEVKVSNPSSVPLRVNSVRFGGASDPAFFVENFVALEVGASQTASLNIWFQPVTTQPVSGTVILETDASNQPDGGIVIEVVGHGTEFGGVVEVVPGECDFGQKAPGSVSRCDVQINSRGASINVTNATIVGGEGVFTIDGAIPEFIPENGSATVRVLFEPNALASFIGALGINTDVPGIELIQVDLKGQGTDGPVCDVEIASINGVPPAGPDPTIQPLDDVVFRINTTHPEANTIWSFLEVPPGSNLGFENPQANETRVVFNDTSAGVDVAGVFRLRATQIDAAAGTVGSCELDFAAVPDDEFLVQLSWDSAHGDLDLHVIQEDGAGDFCARAVSPGEHTSNCGGNIYNDCYYSNCRPGNQDNRPDWDSDGAVGTVGDPQLDVDDLCGFGPENTNVDFTTRGRYLVGVHYYGDTGCNGNTAPVIATIRVYSFGQLVAEHTKQLVDGEFWESAIVDWPAEAGEVCVENLDTDVAECG